MENSQFEQFEHELDQVLDQLLLEDLDLEDEVETAHRAIAW